MSQLAASKLTNIQIRVPAQPDLQAMLIGAIADVDRRTSRRYVDGLSIQEKSRRRIEEALRTAGLVALLHPAP